MANCSNKVIIIVIIITLVAFIVGYAPIDHFCPKA